MGFLVHERRDERLDTRVVHLGQRLDSLREQPVVDLVVADLAGAQIDQLEGIVETVDEEASLVCLLYEGRGDRLRFQPGSGGLE